MDTEVDSGDLPALPTAHSQLSTAIACDFENLFAALLTEFNPTKVSDTILVREMANRAVQMHELGHARAAFLSHACRTLAKLSDGAAGGSAAQADVDTAVVAASERAEAMLRQLLAASRDFAGMRAVLRTEQRESRADALAGCDEQDDRYPTERQCVAHLVRRFRVGEVACPRCAQRGNGSFIAGRLCWECGDCKAQTGIRAGTVMQKSPLPLKVWFSAIRILIFNPRITPGQLAAKLGVSRAQTVRSLAHKIRAAIAAENASQLLAGLDRAYFPVA